MGKLGKASIGATLPDLQQSAIEALERLRKSYMGLSTERPIIEVDQAVLKAVERTLSNARIARQLV
jgi:hypothetical protein